jgi:DNA-binding CsgD family transcriptional regulator
MSPPPPSLTVREREVAALIAAGRTNKQIAAYLGISGQRVRQLIASLALRIGADPAGDSRVAVALWWEHRAA